MLLLSKFALGSRQQALLVISATGLLALLFPLLGWLSGGILVLVALRHNSRDALLTLIIAFAICLGFLYVVRGILMMPAVMLVYIWVPAFISAIILKRYASLPYAILVNSVIGIIIVVGLYAVLGDPEAAWRSFLEQPQLTQFLQNEMQLSDADRAIFLRDASRLMTGLFAAGLSAHSIICVLWGRWQQAALYNPGGFQQEFHALRLGSAVSAGYGLLLIAALVTGQDFIASLTIAASVVFVFQGLAIVHALVKIKTLNLIWLVAVYFLMLTIPQISMILALMGVLDPWIDLRKRLAKSQAQ